MRTFAEKLITTIKPQNSQREFIPATLTKPIKFLDMASKEISLTKNSLIYIDLTNSIGFDLKSKTCFDIFADEYTLVV